MKVTLALAASASMAVTHLRCGSRLVLLDTRKLLRWLVPVIAACMLIAQAVSMLRRLIAAPEVAEVARFHLSD